MRTLLRIAGLIFFASPLTHFHAAYAQQPVVLTVDASATGTPWRATWNWFGADEPNYLTTPGGRALLKELARLSPGTPVYFRPHNLLTTGDGKPALKWGSTNAYTETPSGKPVYNWAITDRLFDAMVNSGITPFVEIGFTPEALSPHPQPYRHSFPTGSVFTGWSYPPDNDAKWSALISAWVGHLRERYGSQVEGWRWEVWNEPDIAYFHGSPAQYFHLYDITAAAVLRELPGALVGGPAVTGPYGNNRFLHDFLEHCAHGTNAATGGSGAPLSFISFHPKGAPKVANGEPQMGIWQQLQAMRNGFEIVRSFPQYRSLPIVLSESDPEGCAACTSPANAYRNGDPYSAAVLEATALSLELARRDRVNLIGAVNWSFLFPGQAPFAGFRELATSQPDAAHPILDKPVLNGFRLLGKLGGTQLPVTRNDPGHGGSVAGLGLMLTKGPHADVNAIATRRPRELDVLVWNYSDMLGDAPPTPVTLRLCNLPSSAVQLTRFVVDREHSNAYTAWLAMGSPAHPSLAQVKRLLAAAKLAVVGAGVSRSSKTGGVVHLSLERNGATLLQFRWK
jgi:xylan 1,4-beta-xylosidase